MYPYYILLGWSWSNIDKLRNNEIRRELRIQGNLLKPEAGLDK